MEFYPVSTLDLATPISKIKALKPDWIYITGYSKDLILARKQMADLNVTAPVVTMITGHPPAGMVSTGRVTTHRRDPIVPREHRRGSSLRHP